jgi:hypothetical protein
MSKISVAATENSLQLLSDIVACLDKDTACVGTECWPGPLFIQCAIADLVTVRELIVEAGLTITEEQS